jgi:hypothetical protein
MDNYQEEIDFPAYQEMTSFGSGTKQYELLSRLEGDEWADYTRFMSTRGVAVGYNQTIDTFIVISTNFGV